MPISNDLLQAKQTLSARLLNPGGQAASVNRVSTRSVMAAAASADQNVHAVGVGRKIVNGQETNIAAVRLYVVQKLAPSLLTLANRLPESIDGMPTDIIESPAAFLTEMIVPSGGAVAAQTCSDNRMRKQRPVIAGISAGHFNITAGTISYFCYSTRAGDDPNKVYVLSNNHVFADVNQGNISDAIYQQARADGGVAANQIAKLHRFFPIALDGPENQVDAAIAELLPEIEFRPRICRIGRIRGTAQAVEDMTVRMHGRTTGYSRGRVTDESYDTSVGMNHSNPNIVAIFKNQMRIEPISPYPSFGKGGDSGSLVVNLPKAEAVGLYFAGPEDGSYGIANYISDVLDQLEIVLV